MAELSLPSAATRFSTPDRDLSCHSQDVESPAILTPRRKIKAMLAAIDSDSDSSGQKAASPARPVPTNYSTSNKLRDGVMMESEKNTTVHTDSTDSGDDVPVAPKGR